MRRILFSCCLFLVISCKNDTKKENRPTFIIGNWERLNDQPGKQTYEIWHTNFTGMGYTMTGKKRSFQEILSIVEIYDTLYLAVKGVNEKPTLFKFTDQTDTSFVCENPENEFPKKITYYLENNQLKAIISADDFSIDFIFDSVK